MLHTFWLFYVKVTEVTYADSEGLRQALSKREQKGHDFDVSSELRCAEILRLVASAERGSEHPLAKVRLVLRGVPYR